MKFRVGPSEAPFTQVSTTLDEEGFVVWESFGLMPQGETDSDWAVGCVAAAFRRSGVTVGEPRRLEADAADFELPTDSGVLRLQVSRALSDPAAYRVWASAEGVRGRARPSELADELARSIRLKAARYPLAVRAELILVLDASLMLGLAHPAVVAAFHQANLEACRKHGFREVWVAADPVNQVFRLDASAA